MDSLLLHICCAPCACYPARTLWDEGFSITGYWFNPNIHGYGEYLKRLMALRSYVAKNNSLNIIEDEYEPKTWFENTIDKDRDSRCLACYKMRLERAAGAASEKGINKFSTTLLYSKFQNQGTIKALGEKIAGDSGLEFIYRDFRQGWKQGIQESKRMGLYRQDYCGCLYSEIEAKEQCA
jgi:predicted adenine nucleotide alpha hydrolase (AANH) superfamily ATPase